jgi:hypothetical protein
LFNYAVRYFNGVNYYEQSSLNITSLADNTANGTIFSVAYAGSQNIMVNYSIIRNGVKEIGIIPVTTDGTTVAISSASSSTANTGVSFSGVISGPNLILQYTTTSTGQSGTMSYYIVRWSDSAGGPSGPPSYSAGSNVPAQATILDNQASFTPLISIPASLNSVFLNYTILRGSIIRTGKILIATDGSVAVGNDDVFAETGDTGINLSIALSGGNIVVSYTSTSTGGGATFKYLYSGW